MNKQELRTLLRNKRKKLSLERRQEAKKEAFVKLITELSNYSVVMSFASMDEEIDIHALNQLLAEEGRLVLPRIVGKKLEPFIVCDLEKELHPTSFHLYEPHQEMCKPIDLQKISCILVPALGFDLNNHRLGYGKGHYDRFLEDAHHCPTFGIGFKEQLSNDLLPIEAHDVELTKLFLF